MGYEPTAFPSRKGESLKDLQNRADLFVEAWTGRVEEEYPDVKSVVIFAHAASVIALGRAVRSCSYYRVHIIGRRSRTALIHIETNILTIQLTGNKALDVSAGCATTSLYRRKLGDTSSSTSISTLPCGVGEWDPIYLGRADYMPGGVERDWSFRDVLLAGGEVIHVCRLSSYVTLIF